MPWALPKAKGGSELREWRDWMEKRPDLETQERPDTLQQCRRCDLWKHATQAVAGDGPAQARIMLVGEQPGDEEDIRGRPFVGPAGRILEQCLNAAALERGNVFITNAVKHFKWEPRGKRRLHKKPNLREIDACNVWLREEIGRIKPHVIVALGATALRALLSRTVTIDAARHQCLQFGTGMTVIASYHPSAILRAEGETAIRLRATLIEDLIRARTLAAGEA
jgi:uracil-DNA glycosylase